MPASGDLPPPAKETTPVSSPASVLLCGATGLVGGECLRLLSADPAFGRLVVPTRRPLPPELLHGLDPSRVEEHIVDFGDLSARAELFDVDQIVCALGTTIRKAGSQERFREVDLGIPLAVARRGFEGGAHHVLLVSALGADPDSRIFYSRVKGELEAALSAIPFRSLTFVRPSLLLGERAEFRLGEEVMKRVSLLVPAKYKPVEARAVAATLLHAARKDPPGRRVIESREIPALAEAYFAQLAG
jgi:uncharacterized protein YbjT (DUF2867 family)